MTGSLTSIVRAHDPDQLAQRILNGDRSALARGLSLVEQESDAGMRLIDAVLPGGETAYVVGITGAPGAGKSTLTDQVVKELRQSGEEVAVLAVDPSSPFSGGAILGDSVRMSDHFLDEGVFIRSMASRGTMGGLSLAVPEAVRLLGAAGFAWIVIETVGVGQVEVDIASAADTTVVVTNPGWGDAVQASKAGLLEVADVLVVNKADRPGTADTRADLVAMLSMRGHDANSWLPPVVITSATEGSGISTLVEAMLSHRAWQDDAGRLRARRRKRVEAELRRVLHSQIAADVEARLSASAASIGAVSLVEDIMQGRLSVRAAAERLRLG